MSSTGNIQQMIQSFITQTLKEAYPNLDMTPGSPDMDTTVGPLNTLFKPFVSRINRWDINQNLDNQAVILDSDLNDFGQRNFFMDRKLGKAATGIVTISFSTIPDSDPLTIPAGFIAQSNTSVNYITKTPVTFSQDDLTQYFNAKTFTYDLPVSVQCQNPGKSGNALATSINKIITPLPGASSVTNNIDFDDGTDIESNALYINRMRTSYQSKTSSTTYGYQSEVSSMFTDAIGVYVAGKGDQLMARDILEVLGTGPVHVGGMVDIYVKGSYPQLTSVSIRVTGNNFLLMSKLVLSINKVINSTKNTVLDSSQWSLKYKDTTKKGTLSEIAYVRVASGATEGDQLIISANYTDCIGSTLPPLTITQVNVYSANQFSIGQDPVIGISSVYVSSGSTPGGVLHVSDYTYSIGPGGVGGSTRQNSLITIKDGYVSGDVLSVSFSLDTLITQIQDYYTAKRFACSDVLGRMGVKKLLYVWLKVYPRDGMTIGTAEEDAIDVVVSNYADGIPLGGKIEESALISALESNSKTSKFIEYVSLPLTSFYVLDTDAEITDGLRQTVISLNKNTYVARQTCRIDVIAN